jgi:hypothetical protein
MYAETEDYIENGGDRRIPLKGTRQDILGTDQQNRLLINACTQQLRLTKFRFKSK